MKYIRRIILLAGLIGFSVKFQAQELFVFTEPASNMPSGSLGVRASNWLMLEQPGSSVNYHFIPELMWGINNKWMFHAEGFVSNRNKSFSAEGGAVYVKYRFFSRDDVFKHFRMAFFVRASTNNGDIHQEEIETNGHNTGYETGLIATQLLHKTALSVCFSYERAHDNFNENIFPDYYSDKAFNYSFSAGRLMWPPVYTGYKQVNINCMLEALGQTQLENGTSFLDIAPSVQFIINSQMRIDIAYKQQIYNDMVRTAANGFVFKVEYLLFNAF